MSLNNEITSEEILERLDKFYESDNVDFQAIFDYLSPLAEQGNATAQNELGGMYHYGFGDVEPNPQKALELFTKSAEQGCARGQDSLGKLYQFGDDGVDIDINKAEYWLSKAAEQGDAEHQFNYGFFLLYIEKETEAFKWFEKSAEQNYGEAQSALGRCYEEGWGVSIDMSTAFKWYEKSAQTGFFVGIKNLAECYHYGVGCQQDYKKAAQLYETFLNDRLSAEYDYSKEVYFKLGLIYESDENGIIQDYQKAYDYYKKAADMGIAEAMYLIGMMYVKGHYVNNDFREAILWFEKAIEQAELPEAKYAYAMHLLDGLGCEQDTNKAVELLIEAAGDGFEDAQEILDENDIDWR